MPEPEDVAERRARLAALEELLALLRGDYDLAMSAFKFDKARDLVARIDSAERERRTLAESLPPRPSPARPPRQALWPRPRRRRH